MDALGFIDDGYEERGYIAGVLNLYPSLRFEYRPMLPEEDITYLKGVEKLKDMSLRLAAAKMVASRLVSWDLKDRDGQTVPPDADFMAKRLGKGQLFFRLVGIVRGVEPSDEDPDWSDLHKAKEAKVQEEAEASGKTVGAARADADLKNSQAG